MSGSPTMPTGIVCYSQAAVLFAVFWQYT